MKSWQKIMFVEQVRLFNNHQNMISVFGAPMNANSIGRDYYQFQVGNLISRLWREKAHIHINLKGHHRKYTVERQLDKQFNYYIYLPNEKATFRINMELIDYTWYTYRQQSDLYRWENPDVLRVIALEFSERYEKDMKSELIVGHKAIENHINQRRRMFAI